MELNKQITFSYILNKLKDTGNASSTLISDEFSEEKEYLTGEYCIKNNTLYKFTADKSAGEWDESLVVATSIGNVLNELDSNITELVESLKGYTIYEKGQVTTESIGSGATRTIIVPFEREFKKTPAVSIQLVSSKGGGVNLGYATTISIDSITTAYFKLKVYFYEPGYSTVAIVSWTAAVAS